MSQPCCNSLVALVLPYRPNRKPNCLGTLSDKGKPVVRLGRKATGQNSSDSRVTEERCRSHSGWVPTRGVCFHAQVFVSSQELRSKTCQFRLALSLKVTSDYDCRVCVIFGCRGCRTAQRQDNQSAVFL